MLEKLLTLFNNEIDDDIGEPPYDYEFLIELDENEYPKYLKKMFFSMTGEKLNLKHPQTFNEKIQWLKLYDTTQLKTKLTDKVLVRNWVKNKIGEEFLKPVLQIVKNFDDIDFSSLPQSFIIKCNHGCKWHYKIKNKDKLLQTPILKQSIKRRFDSWMQTTFFPWAGFEMQYKDIEPQILIEPLLIDTLNGAPVEYEIYCFNGVPRVYQKVKYSIPAECSVYDENFNESEIIFNPSYMKVFETANDDLKKAVKLSRILAKEFKLVRVDWLVYNSKIYFNEMTFTPFSGFYNFENKDWNIKLGNLLDLKEDKM